jgi:hypothetical protein
MDSIAARCKQEGIKTLREYSKARYEQGYDTFVECYGMEEWEELWDDCGSVAKCLALMAKCVDAWEDQRADARNSVY